MVVVVLASPTALATMHSSFFASWARIRRNIHLSQVVIEIRPTFDTYPDTGNSRVITSARFGVIFHSQSLRKDVLVYRLAIFLVLCGILAAIVSLGTLVVMVILAYKELAIVSVVSSVLSIAASLLALGFTSYIQDEYKAHRWIITPGRKHQKVSSEPSE